jgi:hypothetical protein
MIHPDDEDQEQGEDALPPMEIHETENYITAIIGEKKAADEVEDKKGFPGFFDMISSETPDPAVREQLLDILKSSPQAVEFVISALQSTRYAAYQKNLLAMCWEAGLQLSPHLAYFADLAAASDDPMVLIEVQSVIQEMDLSEPLSRLAAKAVIEKSLEQKKDPVSIEILKDLIYFLDSRE